MRITVSSLSGSDIIISSGAVTDIMHKFIGSSFVILEGVFPIFGLGEGEVAFSRGFELTHFMDFIFGEEAAVVVSDVCVSAGAVGAIVNYFSFGRNSSISLH